MLWPGSVRLSCLPNLQKRVREGSRREERTRPEWKSFANSLRWAKNASDAGNPKKYATIKTASKMRMVGRGWLGNTTHLWYVWLVFLYPPLSLFTWNQIEPKEEKGNKSISFDSVFGGPDCIECKSFPLYRLYISIHINFITSSGDISCRIRSWWVGGWAGCLKILTSMPFQVA